MAHALKKRNIVRCDHVISRESGGDFPQQLGAWAAGLIKGKKEQDFSSFLFNQRRKRKQRGRGGGKQVINKDDQWPVARKEGRGGGSTATEGNLP